jgi:hypothetical protein
LSKKEKAKPNAISTPPQSMHTNAVIDTVMHAHIFSPSQTIKRETEVEIYKDYSNLVNHLH